MSAEQMMDYVIQLNDMLREFPIVDYYTDYLPDKYDERILKIIDRLMIASEKDRESFMSLLDKSAGIQLDIFAHRIAMVGVREKSTVILIKGLIALPYAIEGNGFHETLMTISLFYHSAVKLNADPKKLFVNASQYAPNETGRKLLIDFANRPSEHQGIDKMGYKEVSGPSGLIYQFGNRPIPDGWK